MYYKYIILYNIMFKNDKNYSHSNVNLNFLEVRTNKLLKFSKICIIHFLFKCSPYIRPFN